MLKRISTATVIVLAALTVLPTSYHSFGQSKLTAKATRFQPVTTSPAESDRTRDGLVGPVRRVRTEVVKLVSVDGKSVEGKRSLLEVVAYDIKGNKTENQYFPVFGDTLTGKEVYKYDDRGNISEMTLIHADGSLMSRETYKYEFDFAANWNKMTTAVAVVESGKMSFEPTEITYRSIMYYLDENMMGKMGQPPAPPPVVPAPSTSSNTVAKLNPAVKAPPEPAPPEPAPATTKKLKSTRKSAGAFPPASLAAGKLNVMNSAELKNVTINPQANAQSVAIESEPPPPSPAPRPILKPVSGGVLNGIAISLPTPTYPETARRMRTSGTVAVDVVIDENGKVLSAQAASGPSALREAAIQAALKARFSPTKLSGQPVKVSGTINYNFALAN